LPSPRVETAFVLASCAVTAVLVDLGNYHRLENGDSLLPVLISLHRWTPFMWEQDRFGMLIPLLALPFRDPVLNLLVQRGLFLFSGLCSFPLLARWAFGPRRWPLPGLAGAALCLALSPPFLYFGYLGDEPYAPSLVLALAALIVLEGSGHRGWRNASAALLLGLAHWVNGGLFMFLVPAVVLRAAFLWPGSEASARRAALVAAGSQIGWLLFGAGVGWALNRAGIGSRTTTLNLSPVRDWPEGWTRLFANLRSDLAPHDLLWALLAIAGPGVAALLHRGWRARAKDAVRICAALLAAGTAYFLLLGAHSWVKSNGYPGRYVELAIPAVELGLLGVLAVPLASVLSGRAIRGACAVLGVALAAMGLVRSGPPSMERIRRDLAEVSPVAAEVLNRGCTHMAGNYWTVWPAVFLANAGLHERGERHRTIWGVTDRGKPTWKMARAMPDEQLRICTALGDAEADTWLRTYEYPPLEEAERGERILVLRARPPPR